MKFKSFSLLLLGALCLGAAALAADAPKLPVGPDTPIMAISSLRAANGRTATLGKWSNSYRKERFSISGDGVITVDNTDARLHPYFSMVDDAMLADPPRYLVVEWKSRVLEHAPDDHALVVVNSFARIGGKGSWEQQIRFSKTELKTLQSSTEGNFGEWHTFRLAQDNLSGAFALWMDGKLVASGITRGGSTRTKPFFYIGDGSRDTIKGKAEFEYVVIGVPDPGAVPIKEIAGLRVADGRIVETGKWENKYKPEYMMFDGNAVKLIHDSGVKGADYMALYCQNEEIIDTPPKFLAVEWKSRVLTEGESLLTAVAPARPDKGAWEMQLIFSPGELAYNRTKLAGNFREFHTFRLVQYTPNGAFGLWIDGKLVASGLTLDGSARPKPFLFIGDGSGRIAGQAEVEYLVAGSVGE